jgi:hypothetical protein
MDWAAASLLSMEAMGTARLLQVGQARDEQGSCMEHSEIGPRAMASKPKPGTGIRIAGQIFYKTGIATTVCENVLINRTAVVRDPYARWCGRGGGRETPSLSRLAAQERGHNFNNDIEVGLLELSRQKLCKQFGVHRLFDGTNILTKHVLAAQACRFLRKDFVESL